MGRKQPQGCLFYLKIGRAGTEVLPVSALIRAMCTNWGKTSENSLQKEYKIMALIASLPINWLHHFSCASHTPLSPSCFISSFPSQRLCVWAIFILLLQKRSSWHFSAHLPALKYFYPFWATVGSKPRNIVL